MIIINLAAASYKKLYVIFNTGILNLFMTKLESYCENLSLEKKIMVSNGEQYFYNSTWK